MPKLPSVEDFGQSPGIRPQTGALSYKPGTGAEGTVGKAVAGFGNVIDQVGQDIDREQERVDTLRAEDAFNQLRSKQMDLTKGDNGFAQKKGADAINGKLIDDYSKSFNNEETKISETLGNANQKELFRRRAAISSLQYKSDLINHVTQEKSVYADQVYKGTLDTEINSAIERYKDPNGVALSLERINAAITSEAQRSGWAPAITQSVRADTLSKVNKGIIERHLANDDDLAATAFYDKNKKSIKGEDTIQVEKALDIGSVRGESQRKSDAIILKTKGDLGLAMEDARAIKDPKVRQATIALIKDEVSTKETSIKLREDEAFTHANKVLERSGGNLNRIPPDVFVKMSPAAHSYAELRAKEIKTGTVTPADQKTVNSFYKVSQDSAALANMTDSEFYGKYWVGLGDGRERAVALREAAVSAHKNDDKGAKDFLRKDLTLKDMVAKKVIRAGLIDAKKTNKDLTQEDEALLSSTTEKASIALEQFQIDNKRKATTEEEAKVVNDLLLDHMKVKINKNFWPDSEKNLSDLTPEEKSKAYVNFNKVPTDDRETLAARARKLGVQASEDTISKAYTSLLMTEGLPAADRKARIDAILRGQ